MAKLLRLAWWPLRPRLLPRLRLRMVSRRGWLRRRCCCCCSHAWTDRRPCCARTCRRLKHGWLRHRRQLLLLPSAAAIATWRWIFTCRSADSELPLWTQRLVAAVGPLLDFFLTCFVFWPQPQPGGNLQPAALPSSSDDEAESPSSSSSAQ